MSDQGRSKRRSKERRHGPNGPKSSHARKPRNVVTVDAQKLCRLMERINSPSPAATAARSTSALTMAEMPGTLEQVGHEADRAWQGVKKIMSLLNTEFKAYDGNQTATIAHWNGACTDLSALITQGDFDSQRDGDSAKMQRFIGKFTFVLGPTPTNATVRFVVGKYKVGALTAPTIATEMCDLQGTDAAPRTIHSQWDKRKNYDVLYERTFEMDTVAHPRHYLEFNLKLDFDTQWIAAGNTIAANGLFCIAYSTIATGFLAPRYDATYRVEFTDN